MAPSLPLPVRVVVGLMVTGWDAVRNLPTELPALSVSIAGHAVRLSMRVQQEITELAARGDELLAGVTSRPSEHPTWAHFDEEDGDASLTGGLDAASAGDDAGPVAPRSPYEEIDLDIDVAWVPAGDEAFNDDVETLIDLTDEFDMVVLTALDDDAEVTIAAAMPEDGAGLNVVVLVEELAEDTSDQDTASPGSETWAVTSPAAASREAEEDQDFPLPYLRVVPDASGPAAGDGPPGDADEGDPDAGGFADGGLEQEASDEAETAARDGSAAESDAPAADYSTPGNGAAGPPSLPGYDRMTLAQVRGRLRGLSTDDVAGLLAYEQAGGGRAPFLTLLSNRIATLEHEPQ